MIAGALDAGIDLFVTGETDANGEAEVHLGRAIGSRRDDVVIATTVGGTTPDLGVRRLSKPHIVASVDASLRRLGRDWIDLYVLRDLDHHSPLDETLGALHELVVAGKVRELGIGEVPAAHLDEVVGVSRERSWAAPVASIIDYGPHRLEPDDELLPASAELGLGAVATAPLAAGRLARPDDDDADDTVVRLRERLSDLAKHQGREIVDLVLSWTLQRPQIIAAVAGARTDAQVAQLGRAGNTELDTAVLDELNERIAGLT